MKKISKQAIIAAIFWVTFMILTRLVFALLFDREFNIIAEGVGIFAGGVVIALLFNYFTPFFTHKSSKKKDDTSL